MEKQIDTNIVYLNNVRDYFYMKLINVIVMYINSLIKSVQNQEIMKEKKKNVYKYAKKVKKNVYVN